MTRRVERIAGEVLGEKAAAMTAGLTWAGTFHAIGARILRQHAPALGLDPAFTLHDRGDSEDLMNLVRHGLGLLAHREPVSRPRGPASRSTPGRSTRASRSSRCSRRAFPGASAGRPS